MLTGHLTSFRRSLYAKKYIPKGKQIEWDDLVALRPVSGIPAEFTEKIIGKKPNEELNIGDRIEGKFLNETNTFRIVNYSKSWLRKIYKYE